ncbi:ribokinase [Mycetocola spongiae]|uniref:ribokinase n=1 Tax=Mycetocola spongiae TaxID=2859226 RepID=UPI001CF585BB|nr:ribokinase [Mycetocola spongiae]UCR88022.1 ribokinase [Mycetocola spongiae]
MNIAVVGSYGVGLSMRVDAVPGAGETVAGGVFSAGHGGKGSNQAVAAARLGGSVSFLTALGDDAYGREARELWASEGIDAHVVTGEGATMVGVILVEPDGENRIIVAPGVLNELVPEDVEAFRPALAAADIAVISLEIPVPVAIAALRIAHEEGTRTILNPAPAHVLPDEAWLWVDVVTPNNSELKTMLGVTQEDPRSVEELAELFQAYTAADVVVTRGADGALIATPAGLTPIAPIPPKKLVDTTGAGDSFTGALAVALTEGKSLAEAAGFASVVGSITVSGPDVIPSLPHRSDLP